ncbi:hypothetical protein NIES4075_58830 [Tolypothrix sp. NIES-4075]|nr:hypothetical protein NIES4075_58830 [Tolypothrix sp. NIES-4075]
MANLCLALKSVSSVDYLSLGFKTFKKKQKKQNANSRSMSKSRQYALHRAENMLLLHRRNKKGECRAM